MIKGIIVGTWDLLHPGHIYTFAKCNEYCDYLIVGLQVDPNKERKNKNKPIETIFERWVRLIGCKYVDQIIPYETERDLVNLLLTTNAQVRFLDEDYEKHPDRIVGKNIIPIRFIPRKHDWSSTNLRKRI